MKKLLFIGAVFVFNLGAMAQGDKMQKEKTMQDADRQKDYIMMKDDKMIFVKDSEIIIMDQEMVLSNGTMVSIEGEVTIKNGKTVTMKNGDIMGMDGFISKRK